MNRLCLFTDSLEPSGLGAHILTLAAGLRERYQIVVCCPPSSSGSRLLDLAQAMGVETHALADSDVLMRLLKRPATSTSDVDIFHIHAGIGWEGIAAASLARSAGVPVVLRTEHLPYLLTDPGQQWKYAQAVQLVDRVVCVSNGVRKSLRTRGAPCRKLSVVLNGIDPVLCEVNPEDVRERLGFPPGARLILTVGRFAEQKGHEYLAGAVTQVVDREPRAHFLWVGEGTRREQLEQQVERLGVTTHVHFLGRRHDVPALLAAANLFVLPSLFEGLPIAALEAMAAGVPVIGTRVCGTEETITDGVTGRLVSPADSEALAAAILEALAHPEIAAAWSTAAWLKRERDFGAARMVLEIDAVYQECLENAENRWVEYPSAGNDVRRPRPG